MVLLLTSSVVVYLYGSMVFLLLDLLFSGSILLVLFFSSSMFLFHWFSGSLFPGSLVLLLGSMVL